MAVSRHAKLRKLIKETDKRLGRFSELSGIRIWHSDCLRVLREEYLESSAQISEWRSIPLDWSMTYRGEMQTETFFSSWEYKENEDGFQTAYEDYDYFCHGCLELMRSMLLEYLSAPSETSDASSHEQQVLDQSFPNLGFIDDPALKEFCRQALTSAKICNRQGLHLPSVVLVGSALEGLLFSMATQRDDAYQEAVKKAGIKEKKEKLNLYQLLRVAKDAEWITENGGMKLGDALRDYRNLIHPPKYVGDNVRLSTPDFNSSWATIQKVAEEIDRWNKEQEAGIGK